jgi:hypothetical protein
LIRRVLGAAIALVAAGAQASDGVVEINLAQAASGGVTPGDAPGWPVTLSQPGSYRLTGPLAVPDAATTAIQIAATSVTLDLGGFSISGPVVCSGEPASCAGAGSGVGIDAAGTNSTVVRNGSVQGMGAEGVRLGPGSSVESVRAASNGATGIFVGRLSHVSNCRADANGDVGIGGDAEHVIVEGATAWANAGSGFSLRRGSIVRGSTALNNGFHGIDFGPAVPAGERASFEGNTLRGNAGFAVVGGQATGGNICDDVACSPRGARRFYLSQDTTNGAGALGICVAGFHMASLWEIHEPARLEYDTSLGFTRPDSGSGPPTIPDSTNLIVGWVRTGALQIAGNPGTLNCSAWTTTSGSGTAVGLENLWDTPVSPATWPWRPMTVSCNAPQRVWCVED